jgi:hypothetical protein
VAGTPTSVPSFPADVATVGALERERHVRDLVLMTRICQSTRHVAISVTTLLHTTEGGYTYVPYVWNSKRAGEANWYGQLVVLAQCRLGGGRAVDVALVP